MPRSKNLFQERELQVINIGLMNFYSSVKSQDVACVHVDWRPPAGGNPKLLDILSRLQQKQEEGEK